MKLQKVKSNLNKFKDLFIKNILHNQSNKFRVIMVLILLAKTFVFLSMIESSTVDEISPGNMKFRFGLIYLAFILVFYSFGFLLNKNKQLVFNIVFDVLYTALLLFDLWYFRANRDFYGLKNLIYSGTFNPTGSSLINFKMVDIVFLIDFVILFLWIIIKKVRINENKSVGKFSVTIRYSTIFIFIAFIALDIFSISGWGYYITASGWTTLMSARTPGPIGYHLVEIGKTTTKAIASVNDDEEQEIKEWFDYNKEDIPDNEYKSIAKGKNVIFLQLESYENFIINQKVNGKEITPFLNKLTREGLYFNNIYQQNNCGNSIDCDFMVNTSIYPLGDEITALYYGTDTFKNALPRILSKSGYTTISTHAEEHCEFNWTELHKNSFGAEKLWNINDYVYEECVGYGLSDRSFLSQVADKLKDEKEPFFLQMPTLSSHGPFDIDPKYRKLDLPKEINDSYLGGYFESARYTDEQIEMFFKKLEQYGMLDNTMIVIYGDHAGVHKYYNTEIQELDYEGNWWKPYDNKIPLIIYGAGNEGKTIEKAGGQVDILPTVSYLLGIDDGLYKDYCMGRTLVNTNRNATVIKGNDIMGEVNSEEEEKHLLKSYRIGELIIKNDYYKINN